VFAWTRGTPRRRAWWQPPLTDVDAATYLLGPVLGLRDAAARSRAAARERRSDRRASGPVRRHPGRGQVHHGGGVRVARRSGPVGRRRALPVRRRRAAGVAGYPRLSLWADAAQAVLREDVAAAGVQRDVRESDISISSGDSCRFSAPRFRSVPCSSSTATRRRWIGWRRALRSWRCCATHTGPILIDRELRAREFDLLARLAAAVPVWRLRWGTELGDLTAGASRWRTTSGIPSTVARPPRPRCRFERPRCVAVQETTTRTACPGRRESATRRRGSCATADVAHLTKTVGAAGKLKDNPNVAKTRTV
jgi:hypothetical protein